MSADVPGAPSAAGSMEDAGLLESSTIRAVSRRVLPIMALLYFVAFLDRISVGFAQLRMGSDLSIDPAMFGLAAGVFFAGYTLLEIPSGIALDRFGSRVWLTRIGVSWGLVTIATAFVQNEWQLVVARFLLGAAEAGLAPAVVLYAMKMYPRQHRARATAVIFLGSAAAGALGGPICGLILDHVDWFGVESWRWIFVLTGLPAVLIGILTFTLLTDRPADARWLTERQRSWLVAAIAAEPVAARHSGSAVLAAFRDNRVLVLGIVQLLTAGGAYGLAFWSPQILKALAGDVSSTFVGILSFVPYALAAVALYLVGAHSDRTGERTFHSSALQITAGVALLLVPLASGTSAVLAFVVIVVATVGLYAYGAPFWAISQTVFPGHGAAVKVAAVGSISQLGPLTAPYVVGLLTQFSGGTGAGVVFLGVIVILAGVLLILNRRHWGGVRDAEVPDAQMPNAQASAPDSR